jgi:hypothetical protein
LASTKSLLLLKEEWVTLEILVVRVLAVTQVTREPMELQAALEMVELLETLAQQEMLGTLEITERVAQAETPVVQALLEILE